MKIIKAVKFLRLLETSMGTKIRTSQMPVPMPGKPAVFELAAIPEFKAMLEAEPAIIVEREPITLPEHLNKNSSLCRETRFGRKRGRYALWVARPARKRRTL